MYLAPDSGTFFQIIITYPHPAPPVWASWAGGEEGSEERAADDPGEGRGFVTGVPTALAPVSSLYPWASLGGGCVK